MSRPKRTSRLCSVLHSRNCGLLELSCCRQLSPLLPTPLTFFLEFAGVALSCTGGIARNHWQPVVLCKRACANIGAAREVDCWTGASHCLGVSIVMKVEGPSRLQLIGMLTSCEGVILLMTQKTASGVQASVLGDILILVGTAAFASYTIFEKKIFGRYDDRPECVRIRLGRNVDVAARGTIGNKHAVGERSCACPVGARLPCSSVDR